MLSIANRLAMLFGAITLGVIAVWLLQRRRGENRAIEPLTVLGVLMAAQGLVGSVQYELRLPSDIVWVHVGLATATWLALLWAIAAAGRLVPREAAVLGTDRTLGTPEVRELEPAAR